jgi:ribonuclease HII
MIELKLITQFPHEIIATDEAGRGPLGGPVVIGAIRVEINEKEELKKLLTFLKRSGIQDSKKMKSIDRQKVLKNLGLEERPFKDKTSIMINGLEVSCVSWDMDHEIIDQENILAASLRGMKEASELLSLSKKIQTTVLIDGHMKLRWGSKKSPWSEIPIVKGDSKSLLIGLASIIAKEKRDSYMRDMHEIYPHYGFNTHFGYPTKSHRMAIEEHGPCLIHRKTFKGVKEFIRA